MHHLVPGTWWSVFVTGLTVVSFPICILKQGLNVVQMVGASSRLADLDAKTASASLSKAQ